MSQKHPVIAVTGSSGAGTSTVKTSFEHIFRREKLSAVVIEGDSFHRYDRMAMKSKMEEFTAAGDNHFSHFGPEANLLAELARTPSDGLPRSLPFASPCRQTSMR